MKFIIRSKDNKMFRRIWKVVETKARGIRMAEAERKREERKREKEIRKKEKNYRSKKNSRKIEDLGQRRRSSVKTVRSGLSFSYLFLSFSFLFDLSHCISIFRTKVRARVIRLYSYIVGHIR